MALQVRFRHAVGERVLEIPPHSIEKPFVIGRAGEAGLIVPSATVAPRQCMLFVHEGRWLVQEWTEGGTRLNGKPLNGPTRLSVGDSVSIGSDDPPATLEIDPVNAAAGKRGTPAIEEFTQISAATQPPSWPSSASPRPSAAAFLTLPQIRKAPALRPAPPRPPAPPENSDATSFGEGDDASDWAAQLAAASTSTTLKPRTRKRKQSSPVPVVIAIVLAVGIIGGTVWLVINRMQHPPMVVIGTPAAPAPVPVRAPKQVSLFEENPTTQPAAVVVNPAQVPAAADTSPATEDDEPDSHVGDPEWTDILVARDLPDPAPAIVRFDDYRRRNPGKNEKIIDQYEQEVLDRLWWRRIAQLCHRRTRLNNEIGVKDKEIAEETEASYKVTLQSERAALASDLQSTDATLKKDMRFSADDPPDLDNEQALAAARATRDAVTFAAWTKDIETYIRRHSGTSPFGDEDQ